VASLGNVHEKRVEKNMHLPSGFQVTEFFKALVFPYISLWQVLNAAYPRNRVTNMLTTGTFGIVFATWLGLFCAYWKYGAGFVGPLWAFFFAAAVVLGSVRNGFRYNIRNNVLGDFIGSLFFWPQVLAQMRQHCLDLGLPNDKVDWDGLGGTEQSQSSVDTHQDDLIGF
jgi:hypothetical protein